MSGPIDANRALWNEWADLHAAGNFYDVEGFKRGGVRLRDYEIEEVGDVSGKTLLHLQCHFGLDTLSWARLGAVVTGVDFSDRAVELARGIAAELGIDATFVRSELYRLPEVLDAEFDIVYTSRGVLGWLPDVRGWAKVAAGSVKPGGVFYITEVHPIVRAFEDDFTLTFPYWEHPEPLSFDDPVSYAEPTAELKSKKEYSWNHGLGQIVTALADEGLRIELLHEWPFLEWEVPFLEASPDGRWRLPGALDGTMPLMFSLRAAKPTR